MRETVFFLEKWTKQVFDYGYRICNGMNHKGYIRKLNGSCLQLGGRKANWNNGLWII